MFLTHQTEIQTFASQNADNCFKVLRFVQLTIQQNFSQMPNMVEELNQTGDVKRLTNRQKDAIYEYSERRQEIYSVLFSGLSLEDKLLYIASLPGFGLPKAGFVLQCCLGRVGCLDTHNLKRFNLNPKDFVLRKNINTNREKARRYIELCDIELGCAYLWNSWCELIAQRYPKYYADASHVSRLHVDCVKNQY
jgi:hypothetical protein